MSVTIKDVARMAGVSVSTVSKVLNGWTSISKETSDRVRTCVTKLGYTPNSRAVNFARRQTRNIIYLTSLKQNEVYSNPHMFNIMCGAFQALAVSGYTMTLMDLRSTDHPKETISDVILQKSADGIIIHGSALKNDIIDLILSHNFPHIIVGHPDSDSRLCWIDTNHRLAGQYAADYLVRMSKTHAAFIGGKRTEFISHERELGFRQTLRRNNVALTKDHIFYTDSSWQAGYQSAHKLLKDPTVDAIVCENNSLAIGASLAFRERKGSSAAPLPLFMTFDIYPYTSIMEPRPVIIDINVYDMGSQAAAMILRKIKNPDLMIQSYTTLPELVDLQ